MTTYTLLEVIAMFGNLLPLSFLGEENQNPPSCKTRFCGQTERKIVEKEETNFARGKGTKGKSYFIFKSSDTAHGPSCLFPRPRFISSVTGSAVFDG